MRLPLAIAALCLILGCEKEQPKAPTQKSTKDAAKKADASAPETFIKAQLNDRLIKFNRGRPSDNYLFEGNLHLRATTSDGEMFEVIGTDIVPTDRKFPVVVKAGDSKGTLTLRYSTGVAEWTDTAGTLRIESLENGRMIGSFNSEMLRPNRPAVPIRISGGVFEMTVKDGSAVAD